MNCIDNMHLVIRNPSQGTNWESCVKPADTRPANRFYQEDHKNLSVQERVTLKTMRKYHHWANMMRRSRLATEVGRRSEGRRSRVAKGLRRVGNAETVLM
jgi:hypothetical protein